MPARCGPTFKGGQDVRLWEAEELVHRLGRHAHAVGFERAGECVFQQRSLPTWRGGREHRTRRDLPRNPCGRRSPGFALLLDRRAACRRFLCHVAAAAARLIAAMQGHGITLKQTFTATAPTLHCARRRACSPRIIHRLLPTQVAAAVARLIAAM